MCHVQHWLTSSENPEDLRLWDISAVKEAGSSGLEKTQRAAAPPWAVATFATYKTNTD